MLRKVKIYFGNAAKFNPENLYEFPDYTVNENGEVFDKNNERVKEFERRQYKHVRLEKNGIWKDCKVHRIVATTFQDICGGFNEVVNHLDENKLNNCASNLQWTTNKENLAWGTIKERSKATHEESSEIKDFLLELYIKYNLEYRPRNIHIRRLKNSYKVTDTFNNIILKLSLDDVDLITKYVIKDILEILTLQISLRYRF